MEMGYGRLWFSVLGVLVLAACTSPSDPDPSTPSSPLPSSGASSTAVPSTAAAAPSAARAAGVTIERTAGFVGIDQNITIEPDGRWTYHRTRIGAGGGTPLRGRLNDAQLGDLQRLLADPKLGREVAESSECADGFVYTLVTGPTRVQWADCGSGSPPTAMRIVELVGMSTPF
jgi:hypothetical protein